MLNKCPSLEPGQLSSVSQRLQQRPPTILISPGLTQLNHFLGHQVTQFQQVWVLQSGLDLLAQGQLWALKGVMGRAKVST